MQIDGNIVSTLTHPLTQYKCTERVVFTDMLDIIWCRYFMVHLELETLTFLITHSPEAKGMAFWDGSMGWHGAQMYCVHGCVCMLEWGTYYCWLQSACALMHLQPWEDGTHWKMVFVDLGWSQIYATNLKSLISILMPNTTDLFPLSLIDAPMRTRTQTLASSNSNNSYTHTHTIHKFCTRTH